MQSTGGQKRRIQWKQTFQSNKREKKKEKNWLCSGMWDRAHLLLPSGENEDGGESHPADEGQKTHAAQTHDTNKSSSSSRFSLPAYKNHQRENRSRQKNISTSFDVCVPLSLSPAQSLFLFLFLARAREGTWEKRENLNTRNVRQQRQQSCRHKWWTGVVVFSKQLRIRTRDLVS